MMNKIIQGISLLLVMVLTMPALAAEDYSIEVEAISTGYDGKMCWVHPRAGTIPGDNPIVVLTMQKLLLSG